MGRFVDEHGALLPDESSPPEPWPEIVQGLREKLADEEHIVSRIWEQLGVSEYTGKSIYEYIDGLIAAERKLASAEEALRELWSLYISDNGLHPRCFADPTDTEAWPVWLKVEALFAAALLRSESDGKTEAG